MSTAEEERRARILNAKAHGATQQEAEAMADVEERRESIRSALVASHEQTNLIVRLLDQISEKVGKLSNNMFALFILYVALLLVLTAGFVTYNLK